MPFPLTVSPSECPKALSLERPGSSGTGAGAAHSAPAGSKCYRPREGTLVHQDIVHSGATTPSSSHHLCKIETVCGTCMFHSFKKSLPPSLPLCLKCLYKFLFKQ